MFYDKMTQPPSLLTVAFIQMLAKILNLSSPRQYILKLNNIFIWQNDPNPPKERHRHRGGWTKGWTELLRGGFTQRGGDIHKVRCTHGGCTQGGGGRLKLGNEEQTLETFPLIYIDDINYYPHPLPSSSLVLCFNTVSNIFRQIQNPLPTNNF